MKSGQSDKESRKKQQKEDNATVWNSLSATSATYILFRLATQTFLRNILNSALWRQIGFIDDGYHLFHAGGLSWWGLQAQNSKGEEEEAHNFYFSPENHRLVTKTMLKSLFDCGLQAQNSKEE